MTDFRERECYAPPPRDDADWISMSYGECSAQCAALDDDARPFQVRPLSCTHANGTLARNALCPLVRPESIRSCNTREECPPQACSLTRGATSCANGACEKHYHDTKPWIYDYKCTCLNGWTRGETGACDVQIPRCLGASWRVKTTWGACINGIRIRDVECVRRDDEDAHCDVVCDPATKPSEQQTGCSSNLFKGSRPRISISGSTPIMDLPHAWNTTARRAAATHFVLLPQMTMKSYSVSPVSVSIDVCSSLCMNTPKCPGFVFIGFAAAGTHVGSFIIFNLIYPLYRVRTFLLSTHLCVVVSSQHFHRTSS